MIKKIKEARIKAIKEKNESMKTVTSIILGELQRTRKLEEYSDSEVSTMIWKLIKEEGDRLSKSNQIVEDNEYIKNLKFFLPELISVDRIKEFVNNIDLEALKNKMQIIGMVKKYFGENNIDVEIVKSILKEL